MDHDEWDFEADLLGRLHNTLRDDIALHDATEDVHQDGLDAIIGCDDLKSSRDLIDLRRTANVEEIGRLTAFVVTGRGRPELAVQTVVAVEEMHRTQQ